MSRAISNDRVQVQGLGVRAMSRYLYKNMVRQPIDRVYSRRSVQVQDSGVETGIVVWYCGFWVARLGTLFLIAKITKDLKPLSEFPGAGLRLLHPNLLF